MLCMRFIMLDDSFFAAFLIFIFLSFSFRKHHHDVVILSSCMYVRCKNHLNLTRFPQFAYSAHCNISLSLLQFLFVWICFSLVYLAFSVYCALFFIVWRKRVEYIFFKKTSSVWRFVNFVLDTRKHIADFMDFLLRPNHQYLPFYYLKREKKDWKCPVHMVRDCVKTCKRFISCMNKLKYTLLLLFVSSHFFQLFFLRLQILVGIFFERKTFIINILEMEVKWVPLYFIIFLYIIRGNAMLEMENAYTIFLSSCFFIAIIWYAIVASFAWTSFSFFNQLFPPILLHCTRFPRRRHVSSMNACWTQVHRLYGESV